MEAYDPAAAPPAFGLNNTGVICYFNSFLQALAGCTSFTAEVLRAKQSYLCRTATGAAVADFVAAYTAVPQRADLATRSAAVLHALVADLAVRRPAVAFGAGQESASEALVHLLDMMEPPDTADSPITRLFRHRFRCEVHCRGCKKVVSSEKDHAVHFTLFEMDGLKTPPTTVESFSRAVRRQVSRTEDYRCPSCPCAACGTAAAGEGAACAACGVPRRPAAAIREYNLTMIPEIVFCMFNLYVGYGGARRARFFPPRLEFPGRGDDILFYELVGQIEHSGSLSGGHYWARGRRAGGAVHVLNDGAVSPGAFIPTVNTYVVVYHYAGRKPREP